MIGRLAFWTLFPLVIPQALFVKKTAPRFAGASGNNHGVVGTGDRCRLLAIGDSVIAGVGVGALVNALVGKTARAISDRFQVGVEWTALGKIGATSGDVLDKLLPRIPAEKFDVIVVSVGVNDVTGLTRTGAFRDNLRRMLTGLHQHSPNAQIAVLGVPPMGSFPLLPRPLRWIIGLRASTLDRVINQTASEAPGAYYLPLEFEPDPSKFAPDGYHPSEASCMDLGELISETLSPVERRPVEYYRGANVTYLYAQRYA